MRRRISSSWSLLIKVFAPLIFTSATTLVAVALFRDPSKIVPNLFFAIILVAFTLFSYWSFGRLKRVDVDNKNLYVSNWLKEVAIPLTEIDYLYDLTAGYPVFVHLKSTSAFGRRIVFMATWKPFLLFRSHPIVKELRGLVSRANA